MISPCPRSTAISSPCAAVTQSFLLWKPQLQHPSRSGQALNLGSGREDTQTQASLVTWAFYWLGRIHWKDRYCSPWKRIASRVHSHAWGKCWLLRSLSLLSVMESPCCVDTVSSLWLLLAVSCWQRQLFRSCFFGSCCTHSFVQQDLSFLRKRIAITVLLRSR